MRHGQTSVQACVWVPTFDLWSWAGPGVFCRACSQPRRRSNARFPEGNPTGRQSCDSCSRLERRPGRRRPRAPGTRPPKGDGDGPIDAGQPVWSRGSAASPAFEFIAILAPRRGEASEAGMGVTACPGQPPPWWSSGGGGSAIPQELFKVWLERLKDTFTGRECLL